MKRLMISTMLVLSLQTANAVDLCESHSGFAEAVMYQRQSGAPITKLLNAIKKSEADAQGKEALKNIVLMAYNSPKYYSQTMKDAAESEFANKVYLLCTGSTK